MPIRPEYRWLYPIDWPQLTNLVRFERAKGLCEGCGRPHMQRVLCLADGRWWDAQAGRWRGKQGPSFVPLEAVRSTKVVLATAHRDHDPTNNRDRNLTALCQRCHLRHDAVEHARRRHLTYRARYALGDLFGGPYAARTVVVPLDPRRPAARQKSSKAWSSISNMVPSAGTNSL